MKMKRALQIVRDELEKRDPSSGKTYLCWIADDVHGYDSPIANLLKKKIYELLGNHYTLDDWLLARDKEIPDWYTIGDGYSAKMKETRLAWLDWMISQEG